MSVLILLIFILMLSIFLGFEIINKIPSLLHTPLMSGSNAVSGITVLGAIIVMGTASDGTSASWIAGVAILFAMVNVVGGYLVTSRMLGMFKKKEKKAE
jgi:H+-translocating NAD(P) transhydrogenase subunit alpha